MYFHGVRRTKLVGNLGIGLLKPGLLVSSEILNMMDTYFRIINIDNAPCIYGIRPRTHDLRDLPRHRSRARRTRS